MGTLENLDEANWKGGASMGPSVPAQFQAVHLPAVTPDPKGFYGNAHNDRLLFIQSLAEATAKKVDEVAGKVGTAPVTVDAAQVASALAGNTTFLAAIAKAVADENARRQKD